MHLLRDSAEEPRWFGGRDGEMGMDGEWRPCPWPSYAFGRYLSTTREIRSWQYKSFPCIQATVHAYAVKDYGKGRRIYSWSLVLTLGRVRIVWDPETGERESEPKPHRASSLRKMLRTANDALADVDKIRDALWTEALQPVRHAEVFTEVGEPLCTSLEIIYGTGWELPVGRYLVVKEGVCHKMGRSNWGWSGVYGEPSVAPQGWLPIEES